MADIRNIKIGESTIEDIRDAFAEYFFNGDGSIYDPISENRPKKPGRKIMKALQEMGLPCIEATLEQTDYHIRIWNAGSDCLWYDITVDYWNGNVSVD